eukprot:scaffold131186_cov20-Tisochrysis_lutea.AAC.1
MQVRGGTQIGMHISNSQASWQASAASNGLPSWHVPGVSAEVLPFGGATTQAVFARVESCMGWAHVQSSSVRGKVPMWDTW